MSSKCELRTDLYNTKNELNQDFYKVINNLDDEKCIQKHIVLAMSTGLKKLKVENCAARTRVNKIEEKIN